MHKATKLFFSSGGLGDALIVFNKIQQMHDISKCALWSHITGQKEHVEPIRKLAMHCFPKAFVGVAHIPKKQKDEAVRSQIEKAAENELDFIYPNTKITEMDYPFLDQHLVRPRLRRTMCIQMTAGRMNDSTKRTVDTDVVDWAESRSAISRIVLIGPERVKTPASTKVINKTGKTPTILEALEYVGGCDYFIGHDGVCAYYAAFLEKVCVINYHIPTLTNHYYNKQWSNHVVPLFAGQTLGRKQIAEALWKREVQWAK